MTDPKVIFSHGFGVRGDSLGFFPDIIEGLGLKDAVTFDYGIVDEAEKTITFPPLMQQAEKLNALVNKELSLDPGREIIIVAHSQGCLVVALAHPAVKKVIMLAPPTGVNPERTRSRFANRPNTTVGPNGETRLGRSDGSTMIISANYTEGIRGFDPAELINKLAAEVPVTLIRATADEVLHRHQMNHGKLSPKIRVHDLPADHNFTGPIRQDLIKLLRIELAG